MVNEKKQTDHTADISKKVDLIDRQAAIDAVRGRMGIGETKLGDTFIKCFEMILKTLPSAQPDIIRCKDCKHRIKISVDIFPDKFVWGRNYMNAPMGDNDFCSKGERREQ